MSRFEMKFNEWSEHAEHDWLVFDRGVMVAGFAGVQCGRAFHRDRRGQRAGDSLVQGGALRAGRLEGRGSAARCSAAQIRSVRLKAKRAPSESAPVWRFGRH